MLRFKFLDRYEGISATEVRSLMLGGIGRLVNTVVPNFVYMHLDEIIKYLKGVK